MHLLTNPKSHFDSFHRLITCSPSSGKVPIWGLDDCGSPQLESWGADRRRQLSRPWGFGSPPGPREAERTPGRLRVAVPRAALGLGPASACGEPGRGQRPVPEAENEADAADPQTGISEAANRPAPRLPFTCLYFFQSGPLGLFSFFYFSLPLFFSPPLPSLSLFPFPFFSS